MINYTELEPAFTRIHEHKHFAPWEKHDLTVAFREFSKETEADDIPYYPKRLETDRQLLLEYRQAAEKLRDVSFHRTARHVPVPRHGCGHRRGAEFQFRLHQKPAKRGRSARFPQSGRGPYHNENVELAVVMPIYNEEANIEAVVTEWVQELNRLGISFVVLAINDGSKGRHGARP